MPSVRVRENEYFDAALRRFKRACEKAGILTELRRREYYEKPSVKAKKKAGTASCKAKVNLVMEGTATGEGLVDTPAKLKVKLSGKSDDIPLGDIVVP